MEHRRPNLLLRTVIDTYLGTVGNPVNSLPNLEKPVLAAVGEIDTLRIIIINRKVSKDIVCYAEAEISLPGILYRVDNIIIGINIKSENTSVIFSFKLMSGCVINKIGLDLLGFTVLIINYNENIIDCRIIFVLIRIERHIIDLKQINSCKVNEKSP